MDPTYGPARGFVKRAILLPRDKPIRRSARLSPVRARLPDASGILARAARLRAGQPAGGFTDTAGIRAVPVSRAGAMDGRPRARLRQRHRARPRAACALRP